MQGQASLLKSSLASGLIFGLVSGIPLIGALNCACCAWIVAGGVLCSYLLVSGSTVPLSYGRAAVGGLLSGVFSVPFMAVTTFSFQVIMGTDFRAEFRDALDQAASMSGESAQVAEWVTQIGFGVILSLLLVLSTIIYAVFGAVGGLIGRAIFERRNLTPQGPGTPAGPAFPTDTPGSHGQGGGIDPSTTGGSSPPPHVG